MRLSFLVTMLILALAYLAACKKDTVTNPDDGSSSSSAGPAAGQTRLKGSIASIAGGNAAFTWTNGKTVTHVMAVCAETHTRKVAPVANDGTWNLDLDQQYAWVLIFLDNNRGGTNMLRGAFRQGGLDSLPLTSGADDEINLPIFKPLNVPLDPASKLFPQEP